MSLDDGFFLSMNYWGTEKVKMKLSDNKELVAIGEEVPNTNGNGFRFIHINTADFIEFAKDVIKDVIKKMEDKLIEEETKKAHYKNNQKALRKMTRKIK